MADYLAERLKRKTLEFEARLGAERIHGKPGRGHCSRCFTPTMCARPAGTPEMPAKEQPCGCHVPQGQRCRFCGAGLHVTTPEELRRRQLEQAAQRRLLVDYGYKMGAAA